MSEGVEHDVRDLDLSLEGPSTKEKLKEHIGVILHDVRRQHSCLAQEILLLSSDDHYSELIRSMLQYKGFEVRIIDSTVSIESVDLQHTSLILVDVDQADTCYQPLLNSLKVRECNAPVIGFGRQVSHAQGSSFSVLIEKPFVPSEFINTVRQHVTDPGPKAKSL